LKTAWCHRDAEGLILLVRVQPRAGRDAIVGEAQGRLKIRIAAAPVGGGANARLRALLAREFKVPASQVKLLGGLRSRDKRIAISGPRVVPEWLPLL
jgi:uncharacterized protein (TIGR00251 family)